MINLINMTLTKELDNATMAFHNCNENNLLKIEDLELGKELGEGTFGIVR